MHGTRELQQCIQQCHECHRECMEVAEHCLHQGGEHAMPERVFQLLDCAEICQTSANFMIRRSELLGAVCGVCAEVCSRCAEDCDRFLEDERMRRAAAICRQCADSCREMSHSPMSG
jgi:hypothetical protein